MDTEAVSFEDFRACLVDLERVNRASLGYRPTLGFFEELRRAGRLPADRPLEVVDVGTGGGDGLRRLARWAAERGVAVRLVGVDLHPLAIRAATEATTTLPGDARVEWVEDDVFAYAARRTRRPDVVISALFTHHLADAAVVSFLRWMEETAEIGWFVNDLHRHALPYHGFPLLARLAGAHRFVVHDGRISFARAFVPADWRRLAAAAGLGDAVRITRWQPFRLCVCRVKP